MVSYKNIYIVFGLICAILLISPLTTLSQGACRELEVQIPGLTSTCLPALPDYIATIYNFALMISGIICFGSLIYGGFRYLTSAGSPSAINDAKDQISSALIGLVILFSAWLILNTINPQLVILNPTPGGGCTQDSQCPPGNVCQSGVCVTSLTPPDWGAESCVSYNTSADCTKNINPATSSPYCDWCPRCSGSNKINTSGTDACVKRGNCTYTSTDCP